MRGLFLLALLATSVAGYKPFRSLKAPAGTPTQGPFNDPCQKVVYKHPASSFTNDRWLPCSLSTVSPYSLGGTVWLFYLPLEYSLADNFCRKLFQFSTSTEIIKQYEIVSPLITHQSEPQVCGLAAVTGHQDSGHIYSFVLIVYLMPTLVTVGTSFLHNLLGSLTQGAFPWNYMAFKISSAVTIPTSIFHTAKLEVERGMRLHWDERGPMTWLSCI